MRVRLYESAIASCFGFSRKIRRPATCDFCNTIPPQAVQQRSVRGVMAIQPPLSRSEGNRDGARSATPSRSVARFPPRRCDYRGFQTPDVQDHAGRRPIRLRAGPRKSTDRAPAGSRGRVGPTYYPKSHNYDQCCGHAPNRGADTACRHSCTQSDRSVRRLLPSSVAAVFMAETFGRACLQASTG
jgi:hypothetical protein